MHTPRAQSRLAHIVGFDNDNSNLDAWHSHGSPDVCPMPVSQDLTAYKKYKEKAVASAARSLITLFREVAPYMLEKKDRGRGADLEARPMQYGAGQVRVSHLLHFPQKLSSQHLLSVLAWNVDDTACLTH